MVASALREAASASLAALAGSGAAAAATGSPTAAPQRNVWALQGCCNTDQWVLVGLIAAYSVLIMLLWRTPVLTPLKMIVVFLHELGHAVGAWLSCGRVQSMEVHSDEGGVTKTVGGSQWVILPAGYLGSAFFGMILVISSANWYAVQVTSGLLCVALLAVFWLADNWSLRLLTIGFFVLVGGFWACQILTPFKGLQYLILLIGVMSGLFSIYDVHDDLISRRVNGSDAVKFAELTHTSSRCWGVIWAIISLAFMGLGIYLALVVASLPA